MNRFLIIFLLTTSFAKAQLPETDVWLFDCNTLKGDYTFYNAKNISNHPGYDNQPSFSPNGTLIFWTAQRDSSETDIYCYDISKAFSLRITRTNVSEYSPTFVKGTCFLSVVVVEKDSSQRLWKYNMSNFDTLANSSSVILPNVKGVGYSCWYDTNTVFIDQLTADSMSLIKADVHLGKTTTCVTNAGRCLQLYQNSSGKYLLYTKKGKDDTTRIYALDQSGNPYTKFKPIHVVSNSQDFALDNKGNIFMASETKLYRWKMGESKSWTEVADFALNGLHSITRIAISPDGKNFALVDNIKK